MAAKPGPKQKINYFGFLDEVGLLHSPKEDRVFGLGLLYVHKPSALHKKIVSYKDKTDFRGEFKFSNVRDDNLTLYKGLVDIFFSTPHLKFNSLFFDKQGLDIKKYFKSNHNKAYNAFAGKLIASSLGAGEYMVVLADDVSTPKADTFEKDTKRKIRASTRRNALYGICRVESHAVSEIQLVDVLIGCVAYAFKLKYGLISIRGGRKSAKYRLMAHVQKKLGVKQMAETGSYRLGYGRSFEITEFKGNIEKKIDSALGTSAN